jgi:flagellar basal body-associated protein FliL
VREAEEPTSQATIIIAIVIFIVLVGLGLAAWLLFHLSAFKF